MLVVVLVLTTLQVSPPRVEAKAVVVLESTHPLIVVTAILVQQILEVVEVLALSIIILAAQEVLELLLLELLQRPHQLLDLPL